MSYPAIATFHVVATSSPIRDANHRIRQIANDYLRSAGLAPVGLTRPYVDVDKAKAVRIANAYQAMPGGPPTTYAAHVSYSEFATEINAQYEACLDAGLRIIPVGDAAPYASSVDMVYNLLRLDTLFVFNGGEPHPFLSREDNYRFRAIHDVFGHAMFGFSFGPRGEENAWRCHSAMFSGEARPAMTAETRGQNSWFNFGPFMGLPPYRRPYAEQKANLLPTWCEA